MTPTAPARLLPKVGRVLLACLLTLLLSEGLIRLVVGDRIAVFPRFHTSANYGPFTLRRLRPNTTFRHRSVDGTWFHRTNAQGFRADRDFAHAKKSGQIRVLCLGDSHTQGFECAQERTYSARLESGLRARGYDAEVINAGVSGFGTAEQLAFLENEGLRYQPDVVVVGFFANDLEDNLKADLFRLEGESLTTNKWVHIPGVGILDRLNRFPPTRWASQYSYLYSICLNAAWERGKHALMKESKREQATEYAVKQGNATASEQERQQALARALLARMRATCRERGVKLILMEIPQVSTSGEAFEPSVPEPLREFFRGAGDVSLPARETLGSFAGLHSFFVPNGQQHISETTHLLLAKALADAVGNLLGPPTTKP